MKKLIALVTGGNRGIGKQVCNLLGRLGYKVLLTARDMNAAISSAEELKKNNIDVVPLQLDVTLEEHIQTVFSHVENSYGKLDVLINNAGIFLDRKNNSYPSFLDLNKELLEKTLAVNLYAPLRLIQMFLPLMKLNNYGRIVNVSSGMSRFDDIDVRAPFYRMSKMALNALTCIAASETKEYDILINSVCPGWVRSDMGGENAVRTLDEGAAGIIWAATLPKGGANGGFFRDGQKLDWCRKNV